MRQCRVCGCTNAFACLGGCTWVAADLCSKCVYVQCFLNIFIEPEGVDKL